MTRWTKHTKDFEIEELINSTFQVKYIVYNIYWYYALQFFKCPGLCQYRPGHSQGENVNENEQKTYGFSKTYDLANFEAFC